MRFLIFSVLIAVAFGQGAVEIQKHYELEDALAGSTVGVWQWRSEASGLKTLRIEDEQGVNEILLTLCIVPYNASLNVSLQIDDLRYSNDGPSDNVTLKFNDIPFARFTTYEKWRGGHEWNVFRNSGRLGPMFMLQGGQYVLAISAKTDKYGVEFDRIRVNMENQNPTSNVFCGASVNIATAQ